MGLDLCTVMVAFAGWGDRHLAGAAGPPAGFEYYGCGATVHAALLCDQGHLLTTSDRVLSRPGPGARPSDKPHRSLCRNSRPGSSDHP